MTENKTDIKEETVEKTSLPSPGAVLRQGREKMGLSQLEVANQLHLRLNNVQDIESDTHQPSVSITFTKGYVRMYAKFLGIEAQPLLDAFDSLHSSEKTPAKLQSFSQRVSKEAHDERWMMFTYLVVFIVLASAVIWWFQQSDKSIGTRFDEFSDGVVEQVKSLSSDEVDASGDAELLPQGSVEAIEVNRANTSQTIQDASDDISLDDVTEDTDEVTQSEEDINLGSVNGSTDSEPGTTSSDAQKQLNDAIAVTETQLSDDSVKNDATDVIANETNLAIQSASSAAEEVTEQASTALESVVETASSVVADAGHTINADGTVDVVFTFKDDCWVSVRDVNKETMAYGVKKKGRVMTVSGIPPIRVILGAPQNVEIDFGGQAVDMTVHPAGRSANFKLPVVGE